MSDFEDRGELGAAARDVIEGHTAALRQLADALQQRESGPAERQGALASFMQAAGFTIEWGAGGVERAFIARRERLNLEDMRKGLRHGHIALACAAGPSDDGLGWAAIDIVAASASAIGLAATLTGQIYGTVSLICVPGASDVAALVAAGVFEEPDSVLLPRGDAEGQAFQHTINNTGEHLAQLKLNVALPGEAGAFVHELQAAVRSIIDELDEQEAIQPAPHGFVIRARTTAKLDQIAARITALARTRAESSGIDVAIERVGTLPEFQPSRILARRVKTFADTYKMGHDRVRREPAGAPTAWGAVSQISPAAKVRFPVSGDDAISDEDLVAARNIALAAARTGLDALGDMEFRGFVEGEMIRALRERGISRTPRRWLGVHPVLPRTDYTPQRTDFPDVVVRGPGLPDPTTRNRPDDDEA